MYHKCVFVSIITIFDYFVDSLARADELEIKSIAFPSLTSGVFGFPKEICAETIINKCVE
jgi:O-acetyl-ADP-ribose deacetylase (regulator of RNase III)